MKELSLNILDITENSVKAGAAVIEIALKENDETLLISIKDDGCGMSKETAKRIFDPFYTTKPVGEGTGLGIRCQDDVHHQRPYER